MASGSSYSGGATRSDAFSDFYKEVKTIEKRDADLTSAQQIERLLRPGASYFNLNPFEVMRIDPDSTLDDIKKRYKRMSILLHPDKNPGDRERADKAFDILKKAMTTLEDPDERDRCLKHVHEARARVAKAMDDKRRQLKREGKPQVVDEDDPEKDRRALLEDHSFEAFHLVAELVCMCEPSSSNVGTQPNSQLSHSASMQHHQAIVTSNRPVAAELEGALFTLEMLLRYLPDLVARRWQFEAINSIVSKCLQPCNVSAMRKYSMRLFIAWYQAVGSAGRSTPYLDEQFVHLLPFDILDQDGSSEQNSNFQNLSLQARCSVFHAFVERFLESITKESSRLCWKGDKVDRRRRALNFLIFKLKERFLPRCFPDGLEETPFTLKQAQQFAFRKPLDPETSTVICRYCLIRWLTKHLRDYSDVGTLRSGTEPEAPPMGCELLKPVILDSPENLNWTFALFRESLLLPIKCAGLMNRVLKVLRQWHAKPPPNCTSDMVGDVLFLKFLERNRGND